MSLSDFAPVERELLEYVYREFRKAAEWPLSRSVDVELGDVLDAAGGLERVCDGIGNEYVSCNPPDSNGTVALRLRAFELFEDAKEDLENFLGAARYFSRRYRESRGRDREIDLSDYVKDAALHTDAEKRLKFLILLDGKYWEGASGGHFTLNAFAGKISDVKTIEDYLARWSAYTERQAQRSMGRAGRETQHMRYVFLSHAAVDSQLANYMGAVIRNSVGGVEVFIASRPGEIPTGDEWLAAIKDQLRQADTYLVLLTPLSIQRPWIWFETGAAWMSGRRLLPVTVGMSKHDVPMPLGAHQALSLDSAEDVTQLFRDLRIAVADVTRFCAEVKSIREKDISPTGSQTRNAPLDQALSGFRRATNADHRNEVLRSMDGVRAAQRAVSAAFRAMTATVDRAMAMEPDLRLRVGNTDDQLVIQGRSHSLSVVWEQEFNNSLRGSELYVMDVAGRLKLPGTTEPGGKTTQRGITHYDFSLNDENEPIWVERDSSLSFTVEEFSEMWVSQLIRNHYSDS